MTTGISQKCDVSRRFVGINSTNWSPRAISANCFIKASRTSVAFHRIFQGREAIDPAREIHQWTRSLASRRTITRNCISRATESNRYTYITVRSLSTAVHSMESIHRALNGETRAPPRRPRRALGSLKACVPQTERRIDITRAGRANNICKAASARPRQNIFIGSVN